MRNTPVKLTIIRGKQRLNKRKTGLPKLSVNSASPFAFGRSKKNPTAAEVAAIPIIAGKSPYNQPNSEKAAVSKRPRIIKEIPT